MMKALLCAECLDIRALEPEGLPTTCRCGNMTARWLDPRAGTVKVKALVRSQAFILGLNNDFLVNVIKGFSTEDLKQYGGKWAIARKLHDLATDAPGYVFDKNKCACWACIFRVGETADVTWEEDASVTPDQAPDQT